MRSVAETIFFWMAFSLVSGWVLRRFYFSKDKTLLRRLRVAAGILILAAMVLLSVSFISAPPGGESELIVVLLLAFSFLTLFTTKKAVFGKVGAITHMVATIALFAFMILAYPGDITLTLRDTAPIFAALILLANNVFLLLLWHNADKRDAKVTNKQTAFIVISLAATFTLVVFGVVLLRNDQRKAVLDELPGFGFTDIAQAVKVVRALPEVAAYEAMLVKAGKAANVEAQDDGDEWLVQVFEVVKNQGEVGHTATFGWYRVNKKNGVVTVDGLSID